MNMRLRSYFHLMIGICFSTLILFADSPAPSSSSLLKKKIRSYEKYLRSGNIKAPGSMKAAARPLRRKVIAHVKPEPALKVLNEITQSYYQSLFSNYEDTVQTYRYFLEFLKTNPEVSLKELKVRLQQLQSYLSRGSESLVQIKRRLNKLNSSLGDLSKDGGDAAIDFINTPYYSHLLNFQSHLDLERETTQYLVDKIATVEIFNWSEFYNRLEAIVSEIETMHARTWKKSEQSPPLVEQPELIRRLKEDLQLTGKDLRMIRNHFTYTESIILKKSSQLESIQLPSSTSTMIAARNFDKTYDMLESKLRSAIEQEKLELAILETQQKNLNSLKSPSLRILPLSKHLFFNNTL